MNMAFLPMLYFNAVGLHWLVMNLKRTGFIPVGVYIAAFTIFVSVYFTDYKEVVSSYFFEGFGEAVTYAENLGASRLYITNNVEMPYIYVLFYNKIPPSEFINSVKYKNPGAAFQAVSSFGKYVFGSYPEDKDGVYIISKNETAAVIGGCKEAGFGNYAVIIPNP